MPTDVPGVAGLMAMNIDPEAASLQRDLTRAGIEPFGWVINQSLTPHNIADPLLAGRRNNEQRHINEVTTLSPRTYLIPWLAEPMKVV